MDSSRLILKVQALGDRHVVDKHARPVRGCPWCVSDEREELIMNLIDSLNTDFWQALSHTGRWVAAGLDIAQDISNGYPRTND